MAAAVSAAAAAVDAHAARSTCRVCVAARSAAPAAGLRARHRWLQPMWARMWACSGGAASQVAVAAPLGRWGALLRE